MKHVLAQATKEWTQFRRDKLTLALSGFLPIVMLLLFGTALSLDPDGIKLVVEDLDNTPLSRSYVEAYAGTADFEFVPRETSGPLTDELDGGNAGVAVRIPPHFERDLLRGAPVTVQALVDGADANTANALRNTAKAINQSFMSRPGGGVALRPPVQMQVRFWYNPGLSNTRFFGSGALGLVLVLFPALLGALAVSREHETGTIIQVYASTLRAPQWLLGKAIPYIAVGLVEFVVCFGIGVLLFGYRLPPDPTPFLVATLFYVTASVFYGMAVGNVMGTQSAAIQAVQLGAFLISMLLSGFLVPVSNMPPALRWTASIVPATYYVAITRDTVLRAGGWTMMGGNVAILAVMSLVFFALNLKRMHRMQFGD